MVSVSRETTAQIGARLAEVLRRADPQVHPGAWAFTETPRGDWTGPVPAAVAACSTTHQLLDDALAIIADLRDAPGARR